MRCATMIAFTLCLLAAGTARAEEPIKIGAIFSVTGPASFLGEPEKNTALMLVDKLNAAGGLLGKKVQLVLYDDETDVNKCVLAADKLLKKDKVVAVIGPTVSGNTLAIMNKFFPGPDTARILRRGREDRDPGQPLGLQDAPVRPPGRGAHPRARQGQGLQEDRHHHRVRRLRPGRPGRAAGASAGPGVYARGRRGLRPQRTRT